eukprot:gene23167-18458_t
MYLKRCNNGLHKQPASCALFCDAQSCDGCHPNNNGYTVLARTVFEFVASVVAAKPTAASGVSAAAAAVARTRAAAAASAMTCPRTPAPIHASCQMTVVASAPCSDVREEIMLRIQGANGWIAQTMPKIRETAARLTGLPDNCTAPNPTPENCTVIKDYLALIDLAKTKGRKQ